MSEMTWIVPLGKVSTAESLAISAVAESTLGNRSASTRREAAPSPGRGRDTIGDIDDPFAEAPLPSFPLEGATETRGGAPPPVRAGAELESALEEAEFFASRGLFDDARTILDEQLVRLPNHPLLRERLAELEAQERGTQGGSGTRPSPSAIGTSSIDLCCNFER